MTTADKKAVATKKPQITTYVSDEVNAALDQASVEERRSRSQMAAILIEEALVARGYLPKDQAQQETV